MARCGSRTTRGSTPLPPDDTPHLAVDEPWAIPPPSPILPCRRVVGSTLPTSRRLHIADESSAPHCRRVVGSTLPTGRRLHLAGGSSAPHCRRVVGSTLPTSRRLHLADGSSAPPCRRVVGSTLGRRRLSLARSPHSPAVVCGPNIREALKFDASAIGGYADAGRASASAKTFSADKERALGNDERASADNKKASADEEGALADNKKVSADEEGASADDERALADNKKALAEAHGLEMTGRRLSFLRTDSANVRISRHLRDARTGAVNLFWGIFVGFGGSAVLPMEPESPVEIAREFRLLREITAIQSAGLVGWRGAVALGTRGPGVGVGDAARG